MAMLVKLDAPFLEQKQMDRAQDSRIARDGATGRVE